MTPDWRLFWTGRHALQQLSERSGEPLPTESGTQLQPRWRLQLLLNYELLRLRRGERLDCETAINNEFTGSFTGRLCMRK